MPTALIIGASRGIGRVLAEQYLNDGWRVIATVRRPQDAVRGAELLLLDVSSAATLAAFASKIDGEQLDVAILGAGLYGPRHDDVPTQADFDSVMHTNVLAAMRLLPVLAPLVCAARGKLAVISSRMGSMGARTNSAGTLYRASKAALNSVLVDTSIDFGPQGATCVTLHPGWVQTDMGGSGAELTPEHSARDLRATIASLTPQDNGSFLNHDRSPIPW